MSELTVDIITAEATLTTGERAASVTAPACNGEVQILPDHSTYLTKLEVGRVVLEGAGSERRFAIAGGFAEVNRNHVRILADQAVAVKSVDKTTVAEALQKTEELLATLDPYSDEAKSLRHEERYLSLQQELTSR